VRKVAQSLDSDAKNDKPARVENTVQRERPGK
jgi:hypothetical protein